MMFTRSVSSGALILCLAASSAMLPALAGAVPPPAAAQSPVTIIAEGFEGVFPPAGWTATGHWGQAGCQASSGNFSAWVEGTGGQLCSGLESIYHPDEDGQLKVGPFDLSDAITATLEFDLWLWQADGDSFSWGASIDGASFSGITATNAFSTSWTLQSLDLAAVPGLGDLRGQPSVWIAFSWHTDDFAETFEGGYVDDVIVVKSVSGPVGTPTRTATPGASATPASTSAASSLAHLPLILKPLIPAITPSLTPLPSATPTLSPGNHPPEFPDPVQISTSDEYEYNNLGQLVAVTTTITILTPATDPDGDPLAYEWSATTGNIAGISDDGLTAFWRRLIEFGQPKGGTVTVTVSDGRGGTDTHQIIFP